MVELNMAQKHPTRRLVLFTIPKPDDDPHIDLIQRNALQSWVHLQPTPRIVLMGSEKGVQGYAETFGCEVVSHICYTDIEPCAPQVYDIMWWGTAVLCHGGASSSPALPGHEGEILCYVNTDVMLTQDFVTAVDAALSWAEESGYQEYLFVGQRRDVSVTFPWDFSTPDWQQRLRDYALANGRMHGPAGLDYFVHSPGLWGMVEENPDGKSPVAAWEDYAGRIPHNLALGRGYWDNWLLGDAMARGVPCVDLTLSVQVVHQGHDVPWMGGNWDHPAVVANRELVNKTGQVMFSSHTPYQLMPGGVVKLREE